MNNATHTDESLCLYDANMYAKSTAFYTKRAVRVAANANRTDGMRHDGAPELLPSGYSLAAECQHAKEDDEN